MDKYSDLETQKITWEKIILEEKREEAERSDVEIEQNRGEKAATKGQKEYRGDYTINDGAKTT